MVLELYKLVPLNSNFSYCSLKFGCNICSFASRSTGQTVKRQTENLHVDYFVTRDFKSEYKGSALLKIEKNVEEDYVSNVRNNCWKERQTSMCLFFTILFFHYGFKCFVWF